MEVPESTEELTKVEENEDEVVVTLLADTLDIREAYSCKDEVKRKLIETNLGGKKPIVVDCLAVHTIHSSGFELLLVLHFSAEDAGRDIRFRNIHPDTRGLYRMTKLDKLFNIEEESQ